ncbi:hypothetical protein S7711_05012 [Stachybotrys chartarum IBT 7711]|uniref:Clr5 domain-containing protein n=1 Tax=Stachybotrys chartarum (strain CBS 109288 / IBT 7711) TaxID=1280523 RepID=A0A084BAK1_STACB|nr:hypothetical protein S7711_05012 [Stachybotrys chartarum IBT 7711]
MSRLNVAKDWETWKNAIHTLYIVEDRRLEGEQGVIEEMARRHNFQASKSQYEGHLKRWRFSKKKTKEMWQVISGKVRKRKENHKSSNVYLNGLLVPAKKLSKEISRQGFMSTTERLAWAQGSPLHFDQDSNALVTAVGNLLSDKAKSPTASMLGSFLPIAAFKDEPFGSSLAIERSDQLGSVQVLSFLTYMISNNLFAEFMGNERALYHWVKLHGPSSVAMFKTIEGPSADAVFQNMFRLAVEVEDLQMVKHLINMGANPNEPGCKHVECPEVFTPLQYACLRGNTPLVKELIRAGSTIDDAEYGWKGSTLGLAIFGFGQRDSQKNYLNIQRSAIHELDLLYEDEEMNKEEWKKERVLLELNEERDLLELVRVLVQSHAKVNVAYEATSDREYYRSLSILPESYHSPLSIASTYLYTLIVDFLLCNNADASYRAHPDNISLALSECLFAGIYGPYGVCRGLFEPDTSAKARVLHIVSSLKLAGVEFHGKLDYDIEGLREVTDCIREVTDCTCLSTGDFTPSCYHSAVDIAIIIDDAELIKLMISAGAVLNSHCLNVAIGHERFDTFRRLIDSVTDLPDWTTSPLDAHSTDSVEPWAEDSQQALRDLQRKRGLILAAIRLGETSFLENFLESPENQITGILDGCRGLTQALERCCYRGFTETIRFLLRPNAMFGSLLGPIVDHVLHVAIEIDRKEIINLLLEAGANIHAAGVPLICLAIRQDDLQLLRKLIEAGVSLESTTPPGCHVEGLGNMLVLAIDRGNDAMIAEILQAGVGIDDLGKVDHGFCVYSSWQGPFSCRCCPPLTMAILRKKWTLVEQLRCAQASVKASCSTPASHRIRTPLWAALKTRNLQLVQKLLDDGAEVNDQSAMIEVAHHPELLKDFMARLARSPKQRQVFYSLASSLVSLLLEDNQAESIRWILHSGLVACSAMNLEYPTHIQVSETPLGIVLRRKTMEQRHEILQLLLKCGADPCIVVTTAPHIYFTKRTPLMVAIHAADLESVEILLEYGANVNQQAVAGVYYSHAQYAARTGPEIILRALLDRGCDPNAVSSWTDPKKWSVQVGAAIQIATENDSLEMVQTLLEHKASPDAVTRTSPHTSLQIACRNGNKAIVELLLEYGANINAPPAKRYGATALQFAAIGGYLGIAFLLLEKGADVNAPPSEFEGRTALEGAAEHSRTDMMQLLKNKGAITEAGQEHYDRALARALENGQHAARRLLLSYLI